MTMAHNSKGGGTEQQCPEKRVAGAIVRDDWATGGIACRNRKEGGHKNGCALIDQIGNRVGQQRIMREKLNQLSNRPGINV